MKSYVYFKNVYKMVLKIIVIFGVILCSHSLFSNGNIENNIKIYVNPKGWNIPPKEYMKKVSSIEIITKKSIKVIKEWFRNKKIYNSEKYKNTDYYDYDNYLLNKELNKDSCLDFSEQLKTYYINYAPELCVYKL